MFKFELKEGEKLLKLLRQSEITLAVPAFAVMAFIYVPTAFLLKYDLFFKFRWVMFLWTVALLAYAVNAYIIWLLNCYLVTNKRVVVVAYHSVFSKDVSEAPLTSIVNVKYSTHSFQSLFGIGDVEIKATGMEEPFLFKNQREPSKLKDFLWKLQENGYHNSNISNQKVFTGVHTVSRPLENKKNI